MQQQNKTTRKILPWILAVGIVSCAILYYHFDPAVYQFFPKCPFLSLTGLQCPGCGSQRAVHAILHLNLKEAFTYNPLLVISIPYILAAMLFYTDFAKKRWPKTRTIFFGYRAILIVLGVIILFAIFRNF
ncbi:DUF2752 domain-containing protein [Kaistella rhinocerotis]|uniref:DUF2752 domain-containing protein n=1 Tax=Kaistella rhinocerotis TaxID=3026437 RepID=UPI003CC5EDEE